MTYFGFASDSRVVLNFLRESESVDPASLGVIGYCMGGAVAYLAAAFHCDVRAAAVLYGPDLVSPTISLGTPMSPLELADRITCPMLWLSASGDVLVPPSEVEAIAARMAEAGADFECHVYEDDDVGHAFFDEDVPRFYNAAAAAWGWPLQMDFLRRHLRTGRS